MPHRIIQVVHQICLTAVNHLKVIASDGMFGVRKGLHHTVIRNGYGRVSPLLGPFHHLLRIRHGIHIAHLCMGVQLHPLHRRLIGSSHLEPRNLLHTHNVSDPDLLIIGIKRGHPFQTDGISFFDKLKEGQLLRQFLLDKYLHHYGVSKICDRKGYDQLVPLDLPLIHRPYHPIDHHLADLIHDLCDGDHFALHILSIKYGGILRRFPVIASPRHKRLLRRYTALAAAGCRRNGGLPASPSLHWLLSLLPGLHHPVYLWLIRLSLLSFPIFKLYFHIHIKAPFEPGSKKFSDAGTPLAAEEIVVADQREHIPLHQKGLRAELHMIDGIHLPQFFPQRIPIGIHQPVQIVFPGKGIAQLQLRSEAQPVKHLLIKLLLHVFHRAVWNQLVASHIDKRQHLRFRGTDLLDLCPCKKII